MLSKVFRLVNFFVVIILTFSLVMLPLMFFVRDAVGSNWFDDWFQQKIYSGPNYYYGQQRGYITFGSFSARTGLGERLNLINVHMPYFRAGCGGIDLFVGGLGFANFEYIAQRLQRLLTAAPAVAFQIAISILSEKLKNAGINVEKVVDFLNMLQINECELLRGITLNIEKDIKQSVNQLTAETIAQSIVSGSREFFERERKRYLKSNETALVSNVTKLMRENNCDGRLISFVSNGSLIESVMQSAFPSLVSDPYYVKVLRAMIGDVIVSNGTANDVVSVRYIGPVFNAGSVLSDIKSLPLVDRNGNVTRVNFNVISYISDIMMKGYNAKLSKTTPSSEYVNLVRVVPLPVEKLTTIAYYQKDPSFISGMSPVIATALLYLMLSEFLAQSTAFIAQMEQYDIAAKCGVPIYGLSDSLKTFRDNLYKTESMVRAAYANVLKESLSILEHSTAIMELEERFKKLAAMKLSSILMKR